MTLFVLGLAVVCALLIVAGRIALRFANEWADRQIAAFGIPPGLVRTPAAPRRTSGLFAVGGRVVVDVFDNRTDARNLRDFLHPRRINGGYRT